MAAEKQQQTNSESSFRQQTLFDKSLRSWQAVSNHIEMAMKRNMLIAPIQGFFNRRRRTCELRPTLGT